MVLNYKMESNSGGRCSQSATTYKLQLRKKVFVQQALNATKKLKMEPIYKTARKKVLVRYETGKSPKPTSKF